MMRVLCVGTKYESKFAESTVYSSATSFLDYDVLIWSPNTILAQYGSAGDRGKYSLDRSQQGKLNSDISRRTDEIKSLLELGRTIVIHPMLWESYYVYDQSRNKVLTTTEAVLPFAVQNLSQGQGRNVEFRGPKIFLPFWENIKGNLEYHTHFNLPESQPLLFIAGTTNIVGAYQKVNEGHVFLLPKFNSPAPAEQAKFIKALIDIVESINKAPTDFVSPAWSNQYVLPSEAENKGHLRELEEEVRSIQKQIEQQQLLIANIEKHKSLFCGTGTELEKVVESVFKELGFQVSPGLPGRDDLILSYEGKVAVVEVKGVSKSAAESHAAQLEKWVSEYYLTHQVTPKGILVVNAYKDLPLAERTDPAFPDQMQAYSRKREHCLMTGLQLLGLYLDFNNGATKKEDLIDLIFSTAGTLSEYEDWKKFISHVDSTGK